MNDPAPSAGISASLSGPAQVNLGNIELVPALGMQRWATFREIYLTNPWVWAAVNVLARGIGRTPTGIFAIDERGIEVRQRGDTPQTPGRLPAGASLDRLLNDPTPGISRSNVVRATVRDKLLYGNGLWELDRSPSGQPTAIHRIRWRRVAKVQTDQAGENVLWYQLTRALGEREGRRLLPADVVHFGLFEDDDAVAVSPLLACSATLALHDAVVRHLLGYFKNSARTSGHLTVDRLNAEKAKEIRELIAEMYASPENAGKILVTSGKWESTSDSPDHSNVTELVLLSREEIAAAYTIPPPILGILDRAIKSNVEQLRTQYIRDALGPLGSDLAEELDAQLTSQMPGWSQLKVRFLFDEQLLPDAEGLSLVIQREGSVRTVDENRSLLGLPPLEIAGVTDVPWAVPGSEPLSAWKQGGRRGAQPAAPPARTAPAGPPQHGSNGHSSWGERVLIGAITRNGSEAHDDDDSH